ncbi:MAG TPA: polysaccharide biosynthesis protein [Methylomusa anaerophila]|uniref:Stage V sporulation protein B n=1 Tax=Methylomusa anaerophila TaxID=1930071 RepID=A0A348AJI5_9FIRM|nr:polysaccharide biosynthesis protein [Methylomusa anaerophila]BBB91233.1 stage V sporulation protein B [Methylomusa anaerophila]HML89773.1 polysaccharide biosynthesis protein [Methylomusa anaerophila]
MSKDTFLKGAFILTVAGIVVKIIGSVNRILLSRLLGGEGVGLYQMAYPIYLLALSISSAGIPVAISIIVAEKLALHDYRGAKRVFHISLGVLAATGLIFTFLLYYGAGWLIEHQFVRDVRAYYAIAALAPAIFFVTVLSSYRGYFQGLQMMTPTAVSQIFEQLFRVVTMIALAYLLLPRGLEYAAAGASFGAGPGAAAGLMVLLYFYWRHNSEFQHHMNMQPKVRQESGFRIVGRIIKLALPVSLANIMLPVVSNIDLLIVPPRLEAAGHTVEQATESFGYLTGMAIPLVNLATILTSSLAASLVPAVSGAYTLGNKQSIYQRTATAMRIANLITIPSFVGMWLLATPISQMLYGTPNAGICIAILSVGIFLLGFHQVTTGVLQGLGHTTIPVVNMAISAVVKIIMSWLLTAMPELGIRGAAWATVADFGVAAVLNMYFVYRYVGFSINLTDTFKAALASAVMGGTVLMVYDAMMTYTLHNSISTLGAILSGLTVFGIVILLVGGIEARDIEQIPKVGSILAKTLRTLKLLRR